MTYDGVFGLILFWN